MKIIRSSDIASYLFCPVSWWFNITGKFKMTNAVIRGEKHHKTITQNQPIAKSIYFSILVILLIIMILILVRLLT